MFSVDIEPKRMRKKRGIDIPYLDDILGHQKNLNA